VAVTPPQWIVVPNWDKFQHYPDRDPLWIKVYTELNSNPEWRELTVSERGVLVTVWTEYARTRGQLSVREVMRLCGKSARSKHLTSLNHAGFIHFSASKPLALARSREKKEKREEKKARVRAPASDERSRAPAQEPDRDAALAEAFDIAAGWDGPQDTIAFEDAIDQVARKHQTRIPALDRDRLWDIAFGNHQQ
jgi:hypothetical protein